MQLMGRGGRGPNLHESALEVIWNNSDLSTNVPGSLSFHYGTSLNLISRYDS